MRFSQDFLASLRERVPLSQLVGRAVTWDKRKSQPGRGDMWACCPFHHEKSASFHVDDEKGFYHCFGCEASGDHLTFLVEHDGNDFPDAVRHLAELAGVALPETAAEDEAAARRQRAERGALEAAAELYRNNLWSEGGRSARAYAAERGFGEATLDAFGFGLAPASRGLLARHLSQAGFSEAELERVGLVVRGEGGVRDRFRGRLMVPIHDGRGRLVGFGGRTLDGGEPKYLNSPQTALFDKSTLLFNAHRARGPARRTGQLFIVEGYLDAVALAAAGIEAVVASLGTALTQAQIKAAWELADEPVLCFDGDRAGRAAAHRAMQRIVPLLTSGRSFQFLALPEGEDPDDVVRRGGAGAFEALASRAVPLVDALFERERERGVETPERRAAMEARLDALAETIADPRLARLYRSALRERAFQLRRSGEPQRKSAPRPSPLSAPAAGERALIELERIVLGLVLLRPGLLDEFGEQLGTSPFASAAHRALAAAILDSHAEHRPQTTYALVKALPERVAMTLAEVWGGPEEAVGSRLRRRFSILDCEPDEGFLARCLRLFLRRLALKAEMAELSSEPRRLVDAQAAGDGRLLSLSAVVEEQQNALAEAERALADEATLLRRRRAEAGQHSGL